MPRKLKCDRIDEIAQVMDKHHVDARYGAGYMMFQRNMSGCDVMSDADAVNSPHGQRYLQALSELGIRHAEAVSEIRIHFEDVVLVALDGNRLDPELATKVYREVMDDLCQHKPMVFHGRP